MHDQLGNLAFQHHQNLDIYARKNKHHLPSEAYFGDHINILCFALLQPRTHMSLRRNHICTKERGLKKGIRLSDLGGRARYTPHVVQIGQLPSAICCPCQRYCFHFRAQIMELRSYSCSMVLIWRKEKHEEERRDQRYTDLIGSYVSSHVLWVILRWYAVSAQCYIVDYTYGSEVNSCRKCASV